MKIYDLIQFETPRLMLRPVQLGDEHQINSAINKSLKVLQRWMPWASDPSLETTVEFVKKAAKGWDLKNLDEFPMVAIYKKDNKIISATGFNEKSSIDNGIFEIGYWLDIDYHGQGLATEIVTALTKFALEGLKANKVQISTQVDNENSIAVAKRCNFELEKVQKDYSRDCLTGELADSYLYVCKDYNQLSELEVAWEMGEG